VRVGVDGRSLAGADRGVAHYTNALLTALATRFPDDEWRVLVPDGELPRLAAGIEVRRVRVPGRLLYGAGALSGLGRLDRLLGARPDVFWAPAPAPLALSRDVPLVLTLHDLSWVQRPRDFTTYERFWHGAARPRRLARRAARVLSVSEATRREALARWRLPAERVSVVPSGVGVPAPVDPEAVAVMRTRFGLPERYLLFVGALEPRKAPDVLVRAFSRARRGGLDAALVLAGSGRLAGNLAGSGVHLLGRVDAPTRDALYRGALALVLPSWVEGFGFTPLEALAHGTPAVVSDLPVLREALGAGALYVPPGDADALAAALGRIACEEPLRRRLVLAGRDALAELTWPRAAERTRSVLAEAAERRG